MKYLDPRPLILSDPELPRISWFGASSDRGGPATEGGSS
jgi:hypothetical protein